MDFKVIIAPRAIEDLKDIVRYIAPERPEAAVRLASALVEKTKGLGPFPFTGRVVPEFAEPTIRELIFRPYRIIYRIDEARKIVGVARFWHGARQSLAPDDI